MSSPVRVGAVSYLNAKPLYHRFEEFAPDASLEMEVPSRLADRLASGGLDVALIPSVEYLRGASRGYEILPGFAIGASLMVRLLLHAYQGPLAVVGIVPFGAVLGIHHWRTGRVWSAIVAHAIADGAALATLRPGIES